MCKAKIVAYRRVSTKRQGESGLGLEGQETAIAAFATANQAKVLATYTEIESGKRTDRPELLKALAHAKAAKATLVVAKLDRLVRNVPFLYSLMDSAVDFVACDNPSVNRITIKILAVIAEEEAIAISNRTKAALAAYKARGGLLGAARAECRFNLSKAAKRRGAVIGGAAARQVADKAYVHLYPTLRQLRSEGKTYQSIADWLNSNGFVTRRGSPWHKVQVRLTCQRAERIGGQS